MFDSITFKNNVGPGPLLDIGAIAEALLFYGRVSIVGNSGTLKALLAGIPPFVALGLLKEKRLEFYYLADQAGVSSTPTTTGRSLHDLMRFSSPQHTIEKVGPEVFRAAAGDTGQARVGSSQFTRLLRPLSHEDFDQRAVLASLTDYRATERSVSALLSLAAPGYTTGEPLRFRIEQQNQGFFVDTNLDFDELNVIYRQAVPAEHSTLSEAYLLALMQGAYEATYYAATLDSEIAVAPIPLRQNSCRLVMMSKLGATRMKDGSVRRSIQEQSGGAVVAAGERRCRRGFTRIGGFGADFGTLARAGADQARPRAGLVCRRPA